MLVLHSYKWFNYTWDRCNQELFLCGGWLLPVAVNLLIGSLTEQCTTLWSRWLSGSRLWSRCPSISSLETEPLIPVMITYHPIYDYTIACRRICHWRMQIDLLRRIRSHFILKGHRPQPIPKKSQTWMLEVVQHWHSTNTAALMGSISCVGICSLTWRRKQCIGSEARHSGWSRVLQHGDNGARGQQCTCMIESNPCAMHEVQTHVSMLTTESMNESMNEKVILTHLVCAKSRNEHSWMRFLSIPVAFVDDFMAEHSAGAEEGHPTRHFGGTNSPGVFWADIHARMLSS